ncbi:Flp pilus assembly protein CpaB [Rhizorhabdus argentea]|uniref:Flp pilus assembly protein CpaB n=1 Tax=Rhizorhabdus argentea TaxID=1387174 RepID=UPI0030ED7178
MPRVQSFIILGAAILIGLVAVFLANMFLGSGATPDSGNKPRSVQVAVARMPLAFGTKITADSIRMVDWPSNSVPPGAFLNVADAANPANPRIVLRPMEPNEPVLAAKLSGAGGRATISGLIAPDKRAATVRTNDVSGVGGFALPGDMVDVLVTRQVGKDDQERQITDVLLQNIRVIGIDQDANGTSDKPTVGKTATLEVTQVEAQKLALAQNVGTLSLVLRKVGDSTQSPVTTVSLTDLRANAEPVRMGAPVARYRARPIYRAVVRKPAGNSVEIMRGFQSSSYQVGSYAGSDIKVGYNDKGDVQ